MSIIAVVGNKGGAGKTTLAVHLAAALSRRGSTQVLDADPQGSAHQWSLFAEGGGRVPVAAVSDDVMAGVEAHRGVEYLVIDCPPSVNAPQTNAALRSADVALIPVQPSPVDLWATVHVEQALAAAREDNAALRAWLVINQLEARTTLSRLMREAVAELELPVLKTAIRRRAIYRTAALEGRTVYDMGRRGEAAVAEIEQLTNEVLAHE